jgi:hypothetical protein
MPRRRSNAAAESTGDSTPVEKRVTRSSTRRSEGGSETSSPAKATTPKATPSPSGKRGRPKKNATTVDAGDHVEDKSETKTEVEVTSPQKMEEAPAANDKPAEVTETTKATAEEEEEEKELKATKTEEGTKRPRENELSPSADGANEESSPKKQKTDDEVENVAAEAEKLAAEEKMDSVDAAKPEDKQPEVKETDAVTDGGCSDAAQGDSNGQPPEEQTDKTAGMPEPTKVEDGMPVCKKPPVDQSAAASPVKQNGAAMTTSA